MESWSFIRKTLNQKFKMKRILLLGFGREGMSTYHLLRRLEPDFTLTIMDQKPEEASRFLLEQLDTTTVVTPPEEYLKQLEHYDIIFKTPGLPGYLLEDQDPKKITSQSQLFMEFMADKTIGITGTKGKSTTSSILKHVLEGAGMKVKLIGNIGFPALESLVDDDGQTYYVYEMSSFQTEFLQVGPRFRVILNLFQEHLNNYKGYDAYQESKLQLFRAQPTGEDVYCIYGCDNTTLLTKIIDFQNKIDDACATKDVEKAVDGMHKDDACKYRFRSFGYLKHNQLIDDGYFIDNNWVKAKKDQLLSDIVPTNFSRKLLGEHNLINSLVTFIITDILRKEGVIQLPYEDVTRLISEFKGLKHRLEYVGSYKEIAFYNDSISTIPEAAIKAVEAIDTVKTLIIGGFDRTIDYNEFCTFLQTLHQNRGINFICLPTTGHKIMEILGNPDFCYKVMDMEEAIQTAYRITPTGGACLLSPAASSYNQYKNFEDRGEHFTTLVHEIGSKEC